MVLKIETRDLLKFIDVSFYVVYSLGLMYKSRGGLNRLPVMDTTDEYIRQYKVRNQVGIKGTHSKQRSNVNLHYSFLVVLCCKRSIVIEY